MSVEGRKITEEICNPKPFICLVSVFRIKSREAEFFCSLKMDKRYQVFVSSTFTDLEEERSKVIQTLMQMDCIPAGMELFPAADEEQMQFIKKIIDDCDYYIVIIGGRYGSTSSKGISYTEEEYDYAFEKGLAVHGFIHKNPEQLTFEKSEGDPQARERLSAFREKVARGRLVRYWTSADELMGLVSVSLSKTIKTHPAVGWVRGNQVASTEVLTEINELRKRNEELELRIQTLQNAQGPATDHLAGLDDQFIVHFWYRDESQPAQAAESNSYAWPMKWREIFMLIANAMIRHGSVPAVIDEVSLSIGAISSIRWRLFMVENDATTIPLHLSALGLIDITTQATGALLTLTPKGLRLLTETRALRKGQTSV